MLNSFHKKFLAVVLLSILFGLFTAFLFFKTSFNPIRLITKSQTFFGSSDKKEIKKVMNHYLTAWENVQPGVMYQYVSAAEKVNTDCSAYKKEFLEFPIRPVDHQLKYIKNSSTEAKAVYWIDWPDFATGETVKREEVFYLVREGNSWRIQEEVSLEN